MSTREKDQGNEKKSDIVVVGSSAAGLTAAITARRHYFAPDETSLPVDVFLDKPIEPQVLVETISELLGERREEPEYPL